MVNSSIALHTNSTSTWPLSTEGSNITLADLVGYNRSTPAAELSTNLGFDQVSGSPCAAGAGLATFSGSTETSSAGQTPAAAAADEGIGLPSSLDALLYIVIVLLFYAFSIIILMVKYVRREREEASLRNYYHEFVSRDKFQNPQYRNKQSMRKILGRRWRRDRHGRHSDHGEGVEDIEVEGDQMREVVAGEDAFGNSTYDAFHLDKHVNRGRSQTITRNGGTFSRLLTECEDEDARREKESFKFLSAKNQFCKKGFFGKRFCNKQMCSKCVSESDAPTIDWGDGKCTNTGQGSKDLIEIRLYDQSQKVFDGGGKLRGGAENCADYTRYKRGADRKDKQQLTYTFERPDDGCFQPIIECDSELEEIDTGYRLGRHDYLRQLHYNGEVVQGKGNNSRRKRNTASVDTFHQGNGVGGKASGEDWREKGRLKNEVGATAFEEAALVSSCSLEVSELLANMPPLGGAAAASNKSHDLDTLDGLSNLESETDNQSFFNHSASGRGFSTGARGNDDVCRFSPSDQRPQGDRQSSCGDKRDTGCSEGRQRDLSDFLSERTSLLSCTLSIADDGDDDDYDGGTTNPTSFHQQSYSHSLPYANSNGILHSNTGNNGKIKEDVKSNGKSFLRSLSKSASSEDGDVMRILNDISLLTEDSGVFKNLKYFLRGFSAQDDEPAENHERSSLLPKETYFGPGSPKSIFACSPGDNVSESAVVIPTTCESVGGRSPNNRHKSHSAPIPDTGIDYTRTDHDLLGLDHDDDDDEEDDDFKMDDYDDFPSYGEDRWAYAYDEEDEAMSTSDGERSSSFGDYCMGTPSDSQVIDLSQPLARRQLDEKVKARLSQAFFGMGEPWLDATAADQNDKVWREPAPPRQLHKPNPLVAGYGSARKETKV
ncbi:hypothetical protein ElyMa_005233700 [Elysia marginata]|uniref:TNFR-Cys domain-containing protein n=1 Tax=Elysia marginata TaxID=1093978 RepID=A0AAV4K2B9_9GAST|nr:hypothetical protein ElyMa_005233700 [Elysia marginata]